MLEQSRRGGSREQDGQIVRRTGWSGVRVGVRGDGQGCGQRSEGMSGMVSGVKG